MERADIVFRNGTIVDGTGGAPFVGDVAIKDGKIAGVGPGLAFTGAREVDASGKHLMPGWTDVHTHLDVQCMWDPLLSPSGPSGVTTVVMGSCGVGAAPCRRGPGRDFMISTLSTVEDIPGDVIRAGAKWEVNGKEWETFGEYLDCLESLSTVCDMAAMVPHSCVRGYVLGPDRANLSDKPGGPWAHPLTQNDKEAVAACVKDAIEAGAIGFSLNRWWEHRDSEGVLMAGTLADADEIVLCAKAMAEAGGGCFQMHNDFKSYDDVPEKKMDKKLRHEHYWREWNWMKFISKEYGLPVNWLGGPEYSKFVDKAAAQGCNLNMQVLVRPQSLIMNWLSRTHPFDSTQLFQELRSLPKDDLFARLADPGVRVEMIAQIEALCKSKDRQGRILNHFWGPKSFRWETFYPMTEDWDYEPTPDQSIRRVSEAAGRSVFEVAYDAMMHRGGRGVIWQAQAPGEVRKHYDHIRQGLLHPRIVPGISDAGAHLAIFQDGVSPTSMISFWARDRKQGERLPLEHCVKKQARDTAYLYGLTDRGTLEVGKKGDVNMVDMKALKIEQPEPVNDLPTGAYRWNQTVKGYDMTVVSGVVTFEHGRHTGSLPGRLVRNPNRGLRRTGLPEVPADFIGYRTGVGAGSKDATTADAVLETALDASGGASRMSAISLALEESKKQAQNQSKL